MTQAMTYEEYRENKYFTSLTGLRALAVFLVIAVHYGGQKYVKLSGWLGVQIFFVLSGFLITTLLLRENENNGKIDLLAFYIRRTFRILPVYYVVFAFTIWQSYRLGGESWAQMKDAFLPYLVLFNEQTGPAPWKLTWTLGIEWKFYLFWPAIAFIFAWNGKSRALITTVVISALVIFWAAPYIHSYYYTVLMMGAVLALIMHDKRGFEIVRLLMGKYTCVAICIGFAVLQVQVYKLMPIIGDAYVANVYGLAVVFLLPAILANGLPNKILSSKPLVFLGDRSYSMYLIQIIASQACTGFAPWRSLGTSYVIMIMIAGTIIADCLYRWVERPMIKVGHRLAERAKQKNIAVAVAPG